MNKQWVIWNLKEAKQELDRVLNQRATRPRPCRSFRMNGQSESKGDLAEDQALEPTALELSAE